MDELNKFRILPQLIRDMDDDLHLETGDVAEILQKSPETVRRWVRSGRLRSVSPRPYVIEGRELKEFLLSTLPGVL